MSVSRLGGLRVLLVALTTMGCGILSNEEAGPARFIRYEIFSCVPETGPDMQMDYFMRTDGFVVGSASDHQIVLSLREYETATRMQLSGGEIERIPVRLVR